jgi:hypothetical protein
MPEVIVVGQHCTYEGCIPDELKITKIRNWPACASHTKVCVFLGTAGTMQNWIKDYARIMHPLTDLTQANFLWDSVMQEAMDALKHAIITSPAICPINYSSKDKVILAVDSSYIVCGWILLQATDGKWYPSHFRSITWNKQEARYSQAKIKLYGLFHALWATEVWLIGLSTFMVKVDAKYIKGMLSNPDVQPNAAMNWWLAGITLFNFKLKHILGAKHSEPNGLSRWPSAPEDNEDLAETSEDV